MHRHELGLPFWVTHWIRFVCMVVLVVTGFYIANPFIMPDINHTAPVNFLQAQLRFWHVVLGFALFAATITKTYLFFFGKDGAIERKSFKDFVSLSQWFARIRFYLTLNGKVHDNGLYNPLQLMSYIGIYVALYGMIFTGIILFMHVYHNGAMGVIYPLFRPLESMLGGIANVRWIHHLLTWVFLIFLPIHIYMASMRFLFKKSYMKAHS